jgi:hypothetical protein
MHGRKCGMSPFLGPFKTWDNKVVTFFWSPYAVGPFGIAVESMFTKDGSTGFSTGLQEYCNRPANRILIRAWRRR